MHNVVTVPTFKMHNVGTVPVAFDTFPRLDNAASDPGRVGASSHTT